MGLSLQSGMQRKVDEGTEQNSKALHFLYFSHSTCDGGEGGNNKVLKTTEIHARQKGLKGKCTGLTFLFRTPHVR
jgi:hypothetical protein